VLDVEPFSGTSILGDRNRYVLDEAQWDRFVTLLDRPARSPEGLTKLFSSRSAFE